MFATRRIIYWRSNIIFYVRWCVLHRCYQRALHLKQRSLERNVLYVYIYLCLCVYMYVCIIMYKRVLLFKHNIVSEKDTAYIWCGSNDMIKRPFWKADIVQMQIIINNFCSNFYDIHRGKTDDSYLHRLRIFTTNILPWTVLYSRI